MEDPVGKSYHQGTDERALGGTYGCQIKSYTDKGKERDKKGTSSQHEKYRGGRT